MPVRDNQRWLSMPANAKWLLIVHTVDRDHRDQGDPQVYNVQLYFLHIDHASMLITSRLALLAAALLRLVLSNDFTMAHFAG